MRTVYRRKAILELDNVIDTDSYKCSHFLLYPKDMEYMESYFEARGGEFAECTLFALQYFIHRYLAEPLTDAAIDRMDRFAQAHGEPFNREGWRYMKDVYGCIPVTIRAIPEGLVVPVSNVIIVVRSPRDPKVAWVTNWLETELSRLWYPSAVIMGSREVKKVWKHYLDLSSDDPIAELPFKHHDFGSRGVTCREQAMIGGAAHLASGFMGSDTMAGIAMANHYYDEEMSGFSIPATEHSTMTIFGEENERQTLIDWITETLVNRQVPAGMPKLAACVGDSWDIFRFCRDYVCDPEIIALIKSSGGTLVVRPDSGPPVSTLAKILSIFEKHLPPGEITVNRKGYKVLPGWLRIIWGDGINRRSMRTILQSLTEGAWSASNLAMGSGGGLLMDFNRDTQKHAFKLCYAIVGGRGRKVSKSPITDRGKRSKEGRLDLIRVRNDGIDPGFEYRTIVLDDGVDHHPDSAMVTYWDCGEITYHTTLKEVRARAAV